MSLVQERVKCPICHEGIDPLDAGIAPYPAEGIPPVLAKFKPDQILECPSCHAGISYPLLSDEEINSIYSEGDYWGTYKVEKIEPRINPGQYALARARFEFICQNVKWRGLNQRISVLDVGGGHGFIGVAATQQAPGLKKFCIVEQDKFFRDSLKRTWAMDHPDVEFNVAESLGEIKGEYDVIVLSHILEHLNDPCGMLKKASAYLAPGGVVLVDVPHQDYLFKPDVFPHVIFYNPQSMKKLCEGAGLTVMNINTFGRDMVLRNSGQGFSHQLRQLAEKVFYKLRRFLPFILIKSFYDWHFKPLRVTPKGVWLRVLAKKA